MMDKTQFFFCWMMDKTQLMLDKNRYIIIYNLLHLTFGGAFGHLGVLRFSFSSPTGSDWFSLFICKMRRKHWTFSEESSRWYRPKDLSLSQYPENKLVPLYFIWLASHRFSVDISILLMVGKKKKKNFDI